MRTVGEVAAERGRTVDEVLAACRSAGVVAWSAHAPLDDSEIAKLDAALAAPPPPPGFAPIGAPSAAGGPPPPPANARADLPPPPGYWPGTAGPPPSRPPLPVAPSRRSRWVRIGVFAGGLAVVGVRIGLNLVLDDVGGDRRRDAADDIREIADADFDDDVDERMASFALAVGDCFNDRSGFADDPTELVDAALDEVDCAGPHDAEVYAVVEHPDPPDVDYPGEMALSTYAAEQCLTRFGDFVGAEYGTSSLDGMFVIPTPQAWEWVDHRSIVCAVVAIDGSALTGSVAGTGI